MRKKLITSWHVVVTAALLIITVIGWHLVPNAIWGLYTLTDGELAAWNSASIFQWSVPLDPSPQNFLQGLGSLYIPNTPWLNPGALALLFPLEIHLRFSFSYAIYFLELVASVVILGRALGFSMLRSVLAGQLLGLIIFPPFTNYFLTMPWISLAPFNAHVMALCNLLLALWSRLGRMDSNRQNLALAICCIALLICVFFTAAVTWSTYVPIYLLFAFAVSAHQYTRKTLLWNIGTAGTILITALLLRIPEFYLVTSEVTSSHLLFAPLPPSDLTSKFVAIQRAWETVNWCNYPQISFFCSTYPIKYVHITGFAGAVVLALFYSGLARKLGLSMLAYVLFLHLYLLAAEAREILGIFNRIGVTFLLFSSYTFYALFSIAAAFSLADGLRWLSRRQFLHAIGHQCARIILAAPSVVRQLLKHISSLLYALTYTTTASAALVAAIFIMFDVAADASKQFVATRKLPPLIIRPTQNTNITDILTREIGLHPGAPFRGSVATNFGSPGSPLRGELGFVNQPYDSTSTYHDSRYYMKAWYGNSFMMRDLWQFNIPTFEEYGQWITKPIYVFAREFFSFKNPENLSSTVEINFNKLDFSLMPALGIRFIITDSEITDSRLMLRATLDSSAAPVYPELSYLTKAQSAFLKGKPVKVRLYEFRNPNTGSYSPTKITVLKTAGSTLDRLRHPDFDPEIQIILGEDPGIGQLIRASTSRMDFEKGRIRVIAYSEGTSALLLPIQFSHCLRVRSRLANNDELKKPKLMRANLVESALIFNKKVDVSISFEFGPGRTQCRKADVIDYERLDFSAWRPR